MPAAYAEEACGWCAETASCGWQVEDEAGATLTGYFADPAAARRAQRRLGERLAGLGLELPPPVRGTVEDRDWASEWQRSVAPVWASPRIVVLPSWLPVPDQPGLISIVIDPRMAFGTGLHASTRLCLQLLEEHLRPGDRCLDLGTGSGVLAIAAARLGAGRVLAVDIDPVSVTEAGENLARNGVPAEVAVVRQGSVEQGAGGAFQVVLANLQSGILEPLVGSLLPLLADVGVALFSGLTESEAEGFIGHLEREGWRVDEVRRLEGWVGIAAGRA
ncbi:MAG: 50S ribosomal protein L11 methyltransferase [Candidatus Latescibacterota bacterium]